MWKSFTSEIKRLPYKRAIILTLILSLGFIMMGDIGIDNLFHYVLEPLKIENIEKQRTETSNYKTNFDESKTINSMEGYFEAEAEPLAGCLNPGQCGIFIKNMTVQSPIDVTSFFDEDMTQQEARIAYRDVLNSIQDWYTTEINSGINTHSEEDLQNTYNTLMENARLIYNT